MNLPTPDYAVPPAEPTQAIEVTGFADGGVTVVVRKIQPKLSRAQNIFVWIIAAGLPAIAFVAFLSVLPSQILIGAILRAIQTIPSLPGAVLRFLIDQPVLAAIICSPLLWFLLRGTILPALNSPTTVGISPKSVFFEMPGLFRIRTKRLRRKELQKIEIRNAYNGRGWVRYIEFQFSGHPSISVCNGRTPKELRFLLRIFEEAATATSGAIHPTGC